MNFWKVYETLLGTFQRLLVFACALVLSEAPLIADSPAPQPFHLQFIGYEKNPADGSYLFTFHFADVGRPHVAWPSDPPTKTAFKIGDTIGKYKIIGFDVKIVQSRPDACFGPVDEPELTLRNVDHADDQKLIRFRLEYNLPLARFTP